MITLLETFFTHMTNNILHQFIIEMIESLLATENNEVLELSMINFKSFNLIEKIEKYVNQIGSSSKPYCVYICNLLEKSKDKDSVKKYLEGEERWKHLFENIITPLSNQYYALTDIKDFMGGRSIFSFLG